MKAPHGLDFSELPGSYVTGDDGSGRFSIIPGMQLATTDHSNEQCNDREAVATVMGNYQIVAESKVHLGRRLLVNPSGVGYIQLDQNSMPIPMPEADFARLLAMSHYNAVAPLAEQSSRRQRLAV